MKFLPTALDGVVLVETVRLEDDRGAFARTYCEREFAEAGIASRFVQCNVSQNRRRGTLRGMHLQAAPHAEGKLVRCVRGAVLDVAVDVRDGSPTFGRWVGVELSADRQNAVYIGPGLAHGFLSLADDSELFYMMTAEFVAGASRGYRWDDPVFAIAWPFAPVVIAERDRTWPLVVRPNAEVG